MRWPTETTAGGREPRCSWFRILVRTGLLAAPLLLAGLWGCSPPGATAAQEPSSGATAALTVRHASLAGRLLLTGELEAVVSEKIYVPRTPVWRLPIRWIERDGSRVVAGQRVVELDSTQFTGELEQKLLARSSAENELMRKLADVVVVRADKAFALEQRRVALEKARIEAAVPASLRPLREYQEDQLELARARLEYEKAADDLRATERASEADIEELRIALERAEDEIDTAKQAISALTLRSPRDGILVVAENDEAGRKFQIGDNVWVGLPVARIPDLSAMKVVARLSDVDDGKVRVGDAARCTVDAYPELTVSGRVEEVAPIAREENDQSLRRSFRVEIILEESDPERMRPGMSVKVEILPPSGGEGLVVPRVAIDFGSTPPRARLEDGSTVEVRLGACTAMECIVEGGLAEGTPLRGAG